MKKLIVAVMALAMSATMMAQEEETKQDGNQPRKSDRTEMLKQRTEETAKQLELNEEQTAKLLELNTQYADKLRPQMRGQRGPQGRRPGGQMEQRPERLEGRPQMNRVDMEKMRKDMQENQAAYDAELQKILTEDQYKKYKEDEQKRMGQRRPGFQRGSRQQGGPRVDRQMRGNRERTTDEAKE